MSGRENRIRRTVAAAFIAAALPGCMATERTIDSNISTANSWAAVALFDNRDAGRDRALKSDTLDVLALSGGGADGAFGAGVLIGWTESGKRPKFDVVTGVSTGALQSTFAFLGPQYDEQLRTLYTCTCSHDLFAHRGVAGLLGDSLMDTDKLGEKLEQVLTDEILDKVAAEHRAGRRLYVATTNLDAGVVTVWDMGKIASSEHEWRGVLYREILRASAAVPGFFQPVMIHPHEDGQDEKGQMHVDGGVKAPILLRSFMLQRPARAKNVYMLVNGGMRLTSEHASVSAGVMSIAKKSIAEMLRGLLYKTVHQSYVVVRQSRAGFNLGYVPDSVPETKNPLEFDPAEMRALFEAGREAARRPDFWKPEPPRLEQTERIAARR